MYGGGQQTVTAVKDCPGVMVPMGTEVIIPEGTEVQITQAMGGSVTVHIGGNLVRVDASDVGCLGLDSNDFVSSLPENPSDEEFEKIAWEQLKTCFDPEIPINIVDLGLIYKCEIETNGTGKRDIDVNLSLTAPGCGMGDILLDDVNSKLSMIPTCGEIHAELVFDPPWGPEMMSDEARLQTGMY